MTVFHLLRSRTNHLVGLTCLPALLGAAIAPNQADPAAVAPSPSTTLDLSYADLVDLLEPAPMVLGVAIRKVAPVEAKRAGTVAVGWARVYVEAQPLLALRGRMPPVDTVSYLADVRRDVRGKVPALAKRTMLLVARSVPGHLELVQLVAPDAQLPWVRAPSDSGLETRMRAVLTALHATDAPPRITGVREAMYVPGALVGEGETQIFLTTADGSPAEISVVHRPDDPARRAANSPVKWSVSFSEVVDDSGQPPAHDTLAWYRLACFLPGELPTRSNVSATAEDQAEAVADYHLVKMELGPCGRTLN